MNKQDKTIIFIIIAVTIITVIGSTFAYFTWISNTSQRTTVSFTSGAGFSCSANGGGNINSNDIALAPTTCTDTARAIKRTVTVSPTITQNDGDIYLDMWLKVNSIGSGLSNSQNFKYALTTDGTSCTSGTVVAQGNFNGATTNTQKTLLHEKTYSSTTTETYYLWIWLDAAETSSATQGQSFNLELGGSCTNQVQTKSVVYTADNYYGEILVGRPIPDNIVQYNTPEAAMTALTMSGDGISDSQVFLKHVISNNLWCVTEDSPANANSDSCISDISVTEDDCNTLSLSDFDDSSYQCLQLLGNSGVTESYVGFVITPAMATANQGAVAGTYYLKGGWHVNQGSAYNDNKNVLLSAFESSNCNDRVTSIYCRTGNLSAGASMNGDVEFSYRSNISPISGYRSECHIDTFNDGSVVEIWSQCTTGS